MQGIELQSSECHLAMIALLYIGVGYKKTNGLICSSESHAFIFLPGHHNGPQKVQSSISKEFTVAKQFCDFLPAGITNLSIPIANKQYLCQRAVSSKVGAGP